MQVPTDLSTDEKTQAIRKLYEVLPSMECKGLCANSCTDIDMSSHERWLIEHKHQVKVVTRHPATVARTGSKVCRALSKDGKCTVYEDRPLICRAWGVIDAAPCPFGCKPDRYLSDEQYKALELAIEEIGGHHIRTSEDRKLTLQMLNTKAGRDALTRQYDRARAEVKRLIPWGGEDANVDRSDVRGEPMDQ